MDVFYTPPEVARKMIEEVDFVTFEGIIADFSVGDGELLHSAEKKWPNSQFVATDIRFDVVEKLRKQQPSWHVGKCDFFSGRSRGNCRALTKIKGKVDLLLLNPPFSCKGGLKQRIKFNGSLVMCSKAMAFLLLSIQYLSKNGEIVAILPAGVLHSDKDQEAWKIISELFDFDVKLTYAESTFTGCFPKTVVIHLKRRIQYLTVYEQVSSIARLPANVVDVVSIVRGNVSMHTVLKKTIDGGLTPLIHTTELQNGEITSFERLHSFGRRISGPSVLIPRVGRPYLNKIILYGRNREVILSDCLFAVQCRTMSDAERLYASLRENWKDLEKRYGGTCAPYITIKSLQILLESLGYDVINSVNGFVETPSLKSVAS